MSSSGGTPGSRALSPVPPDAVSERIAAEIRSQESFHSSLLKDLAKVAASPSVDDGDNFHNTFLRALNKSGLETRLQNAVFHLLRTKTPEQWAGEQSTSGYALNQGCSAKKREPLAYMIKIQSQWERRILKSLNSMCSELGLCLAKPRCQEEQDEYLNKWNELSTLDIDLSLFRPVYAPKDFLDILSQVQSPNMASGPLPLSTLLRTSSGAGGGHHHSSSSSASHSSGARSSGGGSSSNQQGSIPRSSSSSGNLADIVQMASSMSASQSSSGSSSNHHNVLSRPWGMITVPLQVPTLSQLREKFSELARGELHLGLDPQAPSIDDPNVTVEMERYILGGKVLASNHAPLTQEFLKKGAPNSLRGRLWAQVLGCAIGAGPEDIVNSGVGDGSSSSSTNGNSSFTKEADYFQSLQEAVIRNDVMVDKLIIKDVQLTAANDDNYFVFEDFILQILLCFSRDTGVLDKFRSSCSNAAKATLRGRTSPTPENTVIYPPNGIIPFHGFAMYCAPFAYVYEDPVQLYFTFRAFYLQFNSKLHEVSSDQHGIVSLCALFENLLLTHEPDLWTHFMANDIQPLRLVFRWMMRGFSGHLPPEQLLYLWDLVIAYDSMEVYPLLAAAILSFRRDNLLNVDTLQAAESVLADLSSLPVVPLLQLALEKPRGGRTGAIGAVGGGTLRRFS